MKRLAVTVIAALLVATFTAPVEARTFVDVGVGIGCCGYYPAYPAYYPTYYGYPGYYAPPPAVVYTAPQTVVYAQPSMIANQTSPTFIDASGRTCRQFQAAGTSMNGTACLQPDGVWRSVPE